MLDIGEESRAIDPRIPPEPALKQKVKEFFKNEYIAVQNVTRQVAELARDLVWDYEIAPKDVIHVAAALAVEATIFETYDQPLIGQIGKVGNPPLIIREPPVPKSPKLPGL